MCKNDSQADENDMRSTQYKSFGNKDTIKII